MAKNTTRAAQIGAGIRHVDAAHYSVANMGGVYAHDFCTSLENKTTAALHLAIVDAGGGSVKADNSISNMTLSLHRLAAGEKAPNLACWKEFNLAAATTLTAAGGATEAATIKYTPGALQYTVIGVNLSVACTLGLAQAGGGTAAASLINNSGLATLFPAGITYFLVYSVTTGEVTLTFTKIGATNPALLVNATTAIAYPVTPWVMGLVNLIY